MNKKVKSISLLFGKGFLSVCGVLAVVQIFYSQFEGQFSFSEISITELLFWTGFISLCHRHYRHCRVQNMKIIPTIYPPLRNIGWLYFVYYGSSFLLLIFFAVFASGSYDKTGNFANPAENIFQLIVFASVLFAIYRALPKQKKESVEPPNANSEATQ